MFADAVAPRVYDCLCLRFKALNECHVDEFYLYRHGN